MERVAITYGCEKPFSIKLYWNAVVCINAVWKVGNVVKAVKISMKTMIKAVKSGGETLSPPYPLL